MTVCCHVQASISTSKHLSKAKYQLTFDVLAVATGLRPCALLDYVRTCPADLTTALQPLLHAGTFQGMLGEHAPEGACCSCSDHPGAGVNGVGNAHTWMLGILIWLHCRCAYVRLNT